jgi:hypothetical protein
MQAPTYRTAGIEPGLAGLRRTRWDARVVVDRDGAASGGIERRRLRRLVAAGVNVDERDANAAPLGGTRGARGGDTDAGFFKKTMDCCEHTPLHSAQQQGHGRAVEALVQLGAQVDTHAAAAGVTPLQLSVRVGHHQAAQVLRQLERTALYRR